MRTPLYTLIYLHSVHVHHQRQVQGQGTFGSYRSPSNKSVLVLNIKHGRFYTFTPISSKIHKEKKQLSKLDLHIWIWMHYGKRKTNYILVITSKVSSKQIRRKKIRLLVFIPMRTEGGGPGGGVQPNNKNIHNISCV